MKLLNAVAASLAGAAIVASGVVAYQVLSPKPKDAEPARVAKVVPSAGAVLVTRPAKEPRPSDEPVRPFYARGPAGTFALNAGEPDEGPSNKVIGSLLLRELARQAVLIAARDGAGAPTRDRVLREGDGEQPRGSSTSSGSLVGSYDVRTQAVRAGHLRLWVTRKITGGAAGQVLLDTQVPLAEGPKGVIDYAAAVTALEALSRGEFVTAMKKAGAAAPGPRQDKPQPKAMRTTPGEVIDSIEKLLGDMSVVSQFSALRRAHAAIRDGGESPQPLGALVRGYANLGQLVQFHWNASHKAFKARALLYAERLVATNPTSPDALYHRAYARALTGLHALALDDLDAADRLAKTGKSGAAPKWASLVRDYCRYDTAALSRALVEGEQAPLAGFLCFLTVDHCDSQSPVMGFGKLAMEANPYCLRVVDAMCARAGVSAGHGLTQAGPVLLAEELARRLPDVPGLPRSVRDAMPTDPRRWAVQETPAAVARALVEAGANDSAEPSWTVLGRMIQESQFVHAYRRADFLRDKLGVDTADYVQSVGPSLADHPYRVFLKSFVGDPDGPGAAGSELYNIRLVDPEQKESPLLEACWVGAPPEGRDHHKGEDPVRLMNSHADDLAPELEQATLPHSADGPVMIPPKWLEKAQAISPYMPKLLAAKIESDWPSFAARAAQLESESGGNPTVGAALARQYERLGRTDDVMRVLRRYVTVAPDPWAYEKMADLLLARGDEAGWLASLREYLKGEDYNLDHARIQVKISQYYLNRGRFDLAEPYARDAAEQSGADWAMANAVNCYESLGKWPQAEAMYRARVQRYGSVLEWYLWCVETGHGDAHTAARMAEAALPPLQDGQDEVPAGAAAHGSGNRGAVLAHATYLLAAGKTDAAMALFRKDAEATGDPVTALHVALWRDAAGDSAGRDTLLKRATNRGASYNGGGFYPAPELVDLAELFRDTLATGPNAAPDPRRVSKLIAATEKWQPGRPNLFYFLGKFLDLHGRPEEAEHYYALCVRTRMEGTVSRVLAATELRKRGKEPIAIKWSTDPTPGEAAAPRPQTRP